jgi:sec-independent protein translocase protein TatA
LATAVIVLVIVLLVFGAKRLPEVGRSLGSGMREFKDGVKGLDDNDETTVSQRQLTDGEDVDTTTRS